MNNDELKKKIVEIISPYVVERWHDKIADALIAAWIGDVKDLQAQVNALEITNIALQAGYDGAEKDRLYWINKYKEAEHRAAKAERALKILIKNRYARCEVPTNLCDGIGCRSNECQKIILEYYLQQAEKELAAGRKDD